MKLRIDFAKLTISLVVCFLVAALGSIFTMPAILTWYATLAKPSFAPPNWVFGPVWTILYVLMAISMYLIWMEFEKAKAKSKKKAMTGSALQVFGIQLFLNIVWSFLFFGLKSPFYGLIGIILLWLAIVWTIIKFWKISRTAAWLLVPYIIWVSIASILNFAVWQLN